MPWSSSDPIPVQQGSSFISMNLDTDQAMEIALWSNTYEIRAINLKRVSGEIVLSEAITPMTGVGFFEQMQFGDFNGDGLTDIMRRFDSNFFRSEANGKSFEPPIDHDFSGSFWDDYNSETPYRSLAADLNADGLTDLVHLKSLGSPDDYLAELIEWPTIDVSSLAAGEEDLLDALISVYEVANDLGFWNSISNLTSFDFDFGWVVADITLTPSNLDNPSTASLDVEYMTDPNLTEDLLVFILGDVLNEIKQRVEDAYGSEYDDIIEINTYLSNGREFYLANQSQKLFNLDNLTELYFSDINGNSLPELIVVNSSYYGDLNQAALEIFDLGLDPFSKNLTELNHYGLKVHRFPSRLKVVIPI